MSYKDAGSLVPQPPDSRQGEQSAAAALRESGVILRLSTKAGRIATWDLDLVTGECLISPRMAQLIGLSPDQATVLSSVWWEWVVPEDRPRLGAAVDSAVEGGEPFDTEFKVQLEGGTERWLYVQGAVVRDALGKALRLHGASIDITERKRAEEALREREAELKELNATLEARVSERTKAVRRLAAELTLTESRERHRIAQLLHDELQQQLHGVQFALHDTQRFLGSSDVKAGQARLEEAYELLRTALSISRGLTSDLSPMVLSGEGLIEALHWLATRMQELHGLQVNLRVAEDLSLPHEALRVLLFQIVRELLFNVVKHAGVSEATVTLKQEVDGTLKIEVADRGQGFDPAHLESAVSKVTGLGLASIQNRLEFFGGGLEVLSAPGEGSSFTIVLPTASLTLS